MLDKFFRLESYLRDRLGTAWDPKRRAAEIREEIKADAQANVYAAMTYDRRPYADRSHGNARHIRRPRL
jgi:hypothetical protein